MDAASHNPFAEALSALTAPVAEELPAEPAEEVGPRVLPQIRTQTEKKGRGGKTVTVITGLEELESEELEELATELKKALGTGATVEGSALVVQGEVARRIHAWFAARRG